MSHTEGRRIYGGLPEVLWYEGPWGQPNSAHPSVVGVAAAQTNIVIIGVIIVSCSLTCSRVEERAFRTACVSRLSGEEQRQTRGDVVTINVAYCLGTNGTSASSSTSCSMATDSH